VKVLPNGDFIETTGSSLAHGGVAEIKSHIKKLLAAEGGVIFVDEAYQLVEAHNPNGKSVLDFMLAEIENQVGKIVFILAGYTKQMEKFFEHNPGLPSRIPYKLLFEDYADDELLQMLWRLIDKKYQGKMKIEGGRGGLYMRILIKRLGRGRGREGFGNARALETLFAKVRERQAYRLQLERRDGISPDDYLIIKEDLIGPDPSEAIIQSKAWDSLQGLTGLNSVKQSVQASIDLISTNYQRELREEPPIETSLNRVFLGSPGMSQSHC
jgi:AAA lid domain/ATPase family associated with various cellular activities (AAA)